MHRVIAPRKLLAGDAFIFAFLFFVFAAFDHFAFLFFGSTKQRISTLQKSIGCGKF
jgi:hypothetical protein